MEELDLKELFNIFWKGKIKIILIVAIFVVIGFVYTTSFVTPKYTASTTLVLATADKEGSQTSSNTTESTNSITTTDVTLNSKLVSTYSELVKSKNVLREVIDNLGVDISEESLRGSVSVSSVKDTELIEISVTNINPTNSAKVANEIAKVFTNKIGEIYNINNVHIVDEAETPTSPSNVNHVKDILIFTIIGLVISVIYILIANMLDTTIKSEDEIEQNLKVAVLTSIPVYNPENERKGKGRDRV